MLPIPFHKEPNFIMIVHSNQTFFFGDVNKIKYDIITCFSFFKTYRAPLKTDFVN